MAKVHFFYASSSLFLSGFQMKLAIKLKMMVRIARIIARMR
ncbi:hypothetical protein PNI0360_00083, partial [Streptococcus pneumoniae PNI0360]